MVIYSHGNNEDMGDVDDYLRMMARCCRVNITAYDYSGYGLATGKPSEANLYADLEAVYEHVINVYDVAPENIVLFGRSLGSGPAIQLAARKKVVLFYHTTSYSRLFSISNCSFACS